MACAHRGKIASNNARGSTAESRWPTTGRAASSAARPFAADTMKSVIPLALVRTHSSTNKGSKLASSAARNQTSLDSGLVKPAQHNERGSDGKGGSTFRAPWKNEGR